MKSAEYLDADLQNPYFEGYTQTVEVTKLFVRNFYGELIHGAMNFPGSWHETKVASVSGLYDPKLGDDMKPPEMAIPTNSAFGNNARVTNGKIIVPRKKNKSMIFPLLPSERR